MKLLIKRLLGDSLPAIIFFSILLVLFFLAPGFKGITGLAISNSIVLDTPNATESNSPITGSINLFLIQHLLASSKLKLEFNNLVQEKPLKVILDELLIDYKESGEQITPTNPKSIITMIYPSAGQQQIALKLPAGSIIDSIEMDISGQQYNNEYPYFPYMDIEGDGKYEWQHFGNLLGYLNQNITPLGLILTGSEGTTKIKDSTQNYYFCELINLPYSKDFLVRSKYALYDASRTTGNIKAAILSLRQTGTSYDATGGGENCDLPEPSTTSTWKSCNIHFENPIEGNSLVCVYNDNAGNSNLDFYKISNDQSLKSTAFVCDQPISGESACTKVTSNDDFYILVSPANYSRRLDSTTKFSSGFTQNPVELALNAYLEACPTDTDCAVPIKINSGSKGQIRLSNLVVSYTIGSLSKEENNFYDSQYTPSKITEINGIPLTQGTNISIPLSYFELTAPEPSLDFETYNLVVSLDSLSATQSINVSKVFNVSELESTTKASIIKSKLETISSRESELLDLAGLNLATSISELNDYQSQIDLIAQSDKSPSQKEAEISTILAAMESSLTDVPIKVTPIESVTDIFAAEPDDVTQEILLPNQQKIDLYNYQKEVDIKISATAYELETYSGAKEIKTLIKKTVTANVPNAYIVETIPKSIAPKVDAITFSINPEVINPDPIVKWFYPSLTTESITYLVNGNALSYINNIKTIVVPQNIPIKEKAVCGDKKCHYITVDGKREYIETSETCPQDCKAKTPWGWVIFLLIILIAGVYYINWYRGKYAFKEITGGLFTSKTDFNNLYRYVETSLRQNVPKEKIESKLVERGWTKHQITYVFRKVQSAGKPKPSLKEGIKTLFKKKK